MEDGIETYKNTLINSLYIEKDNEYIYVHIPQNGEITVLHNKKEAIEYSKKNNCKIEIFEKEIKGFYRPIQEFYINGLYFKELN
jgi:hypothetical protein